MIKIVETLGTIDFDLDAADKTDYRSFVKSVEELSGMKRKRFFLSDRKGTWEVQFGEGAYSHTRFVLFVEEGS